MYDKDNLTFEEKLLPNQAEPIAKSGEMPNKLCSLHTISPYIGKMRPELAAWAIERVSAPGDLIYDPFCGSGTVLLEGWASGRRVTGSDLNPYAWLVSKAKIFPYEDRSPESVERILLKYADEAQELSSASQPDDFEPWAADFFHPETLKDLMGWLQVLKRHEDAFALGCLLGIAHHQRPGFLSYPASHTTPYLRTSKFPKEEFHDMYQYREVFPRLKRKLFRALACVPNLDFSIPRSVHVCDAAEFKPEERVDAIVTSPPYMGQLDYARDNRLRLHLLGVKEWEALNRKISPNATNFVEQMNNCLGVWRSVLKPGGRLAILIGETTNTTRRRLDTLVTQLVSEKWPDYELRQVMQSSIPDARRTRKNCRGSTSESLLVFQFRP